LPSSVYLRFRCVALLDVLLSTPASAPRCRLDLHLESKLVLEELTSLKDVVNDELSRAQALLAEARERRQDVMTNKKKFGVGSEPPMVTIKAGEVTA
jgi:hypothetical protein